MNRSALMMSMLAGFSFCAAGAFGQNVVEDRGTGRTLPAIAVSEQQTRECIDRVARLGGSAGSAEAERIRRKLNAHVAEFLKGAPWMPFHHTLGISGYEVYFSHPDELFYTLSIGVPFLSAENAAKVKRHLTEELKRFPPYAVEGFGFRQGLARESYQVPETLRMSGEGKARSAFGVHAFWAFCHYAEAPVLAKSHWRAVKARIEPLLEGEYRFDVNKQDYTNDEAERLNGDLAGLIGFVRLAQANGDMKAEARGRRAVQQLLELRVNLERVNARILEKTTASKSLHISKLARYCGLTPEIG